MTPEQKAAYIIAQSVEAFGKMQGMVADNVMAAKQGGYPVYFQPDFAKVILDHGLHHNALMTFFHD